MYHKSYEEPNFKTWHFCYYRIFNECLIQISKNKHFYIQKIAGFIVMVLLVSNPWFNLWPLLIRLYWDSHIDLIIAQRWKTSSWYSKRVDIKRHHVISIHFRTSFINIVCFTFTRPSFYGKAVLWGLSLTDWWTHLAIIK